MKKRTYLGVLAVVAGAAGAALPPAHAGTTLWIRLPSVVSVSETAFAAQKCPASFLTSGLQSVDAAVADVHVAAAAHRTIAAGWGETEAVPTAVLHVKYYPANCGLAPLGYQDGSGSPGGVVLHPPANAYWAVFTAETTANVTVTLP